MENLYSIQIENGTTLLMLIHHWICMFALTPAFLCAVERSALLIFSFRLTLTSIIGSENLLAFGFFV